MTVPQLLLGGPVPDPEPLDVLGRGVPRDLHRGRPGRLGAGYPDGGGLETVVDFLIFLLFLFRKRFSSKWCTQYSLCGYW